MTGARRSFEETEAQKLDVMILGATGFTGKYVLRETLECFTSTLQSEEEAAFSLGVVGRRAAKLEEVLAWATATCTQPPPESAVSQIERIIADAENAGEMEKACSRARVVVNCVGPYLEYGEAIVAACVEAGVHYVDVSGEAEFMERIEAKYGERALERRSLVVSGCASVSLISDLGLLFHLRQWPLHTVPSCVDTYARFPSFTCNYAASARTGFLALAHADRLAAFRRSAPRKPKLKIRGYPPADKGKFVHWQDRVGVWATSIPIADRSVVRRTFWALHGHELGLPTLTQESNNIMSVSTDVAARFDPMKEKLWKPIKPVHYRVFFGARTLRNALLFTAMAHLVALLAPYEWGLKLLLRYPALFTAGRFTSKGPKEEDLQRTRFEAWFVGRGFSSVKKVEENGTQPNMEVVTRVEGPESAYLVTAISAAQCALLCLRERSSLPVGGVLTTATAFGGSSLQQRLQVRGISFELISSSPLTSSFGPPPSPTTHHYRSSILVVFVLAILGLLSLPLYGDFIVRGVVV